MRRYPELKDSGVKWIGMVPKHWKIIRTKYLGILKNGLTYSPSDVCDESNGTLVLRSSNIQNGQLSFKDNVYVSCKVPSNLMVQNGDILICSRNGSRELVGKSALIEDVNATFGAFMMIYRCKNPQFMRYIFNSSFFTHYMGNFSTSTINQLTKSNFYNMRFPLPLLPEQEQIARFLDWKTSDIDSLISVRQKQVEKLKELRTSVISSAVTRGLDPSAPMKDSGVKWIGMVPRHWDIQRMTRFFSFRKGLSITKRDLMECGVAVVNYGQIHSKENNGVGLKNDLVKFVDETYLDSCPSALTENGDSIFADTSEDILGCGNSIYVDWNVKIFAGYHTLIAHPGEIGKHRYFAYLFKSEAWRNQVRENVNGVKVYSITQGMLKNTSILLPPLSEQEKIVKYLDTRTAEIDKLIATYEDEIARLSEFKTALISEVVTGKIDVRGVRVPESVVQKKEALQCRQT